MDFTKEQKDIFLHDPAEHACILAGPGTGKSSTIISYISQIKARYPEKKVRLLTFTRSANLELTGKILESCDESVESGTVHSFAISVLLNNPGTSGLPEPLRIADGWERKNLIEHDLARRSGLGVRMINELIALMSAFWESLAKDTGSSISTKLKAKFMGFWDEHRMIFGYSLLSELPFRLKYAIEGNPDLDLGNFDLIAIDEYQDLNACDLACFKMIAERGTTILAIGDDDQSVYGFRKAHPAGIRSFQSDYRSILYPLSISHRCGKKILDWANFVIEGETTRPAKPSLSPGEKNPEGVVAYLGFNRENDEATGIMKLMNWLSGTEEIPHEEILILTRTSTVAKAIKNIFQINKIVYSEPEEIVNVLNLRKTRELLAVLKLLINRDDSLAWFTLIELTPCIGASAVDRIYNYAKGKSLTFGESLTKTFCDRNIFPGNDKLAKLVTDTVNIVDQAELPDRNKNWGECIQQLIIDGKLPEPESIFLELLKTIDKARAGKETLFSQYISQLEPSLRDLANIKEPGKIRIMSIGSSKGLTVRATIIAGVEEGIIPLPVGDRQEERRLLYVGMTRSREYLFLTKCRRRTGQSAHSGSGNVAGIRKSCPFLDGGPVSETDGNTFIAKLS